MKKLLKACGVRVKLVNYDFMDFLGFNFISYSKRKITKEKAEEIVDDMIYKGYQNIKKVALLDDSFSLEQMLEILDFASFDAVQLYSDDIQKFKILKQKGFFMIKPFKISENNDFEKYEDICDLFIIDGANPGSGEKYDYQKVNQLDLRKNFLLAGGVQLENIEKILKIFGENDYFVGVDVASGVDNGKNIDLEKVEKIFNLLNNKNV